RGLFVLACLSIGMSVHANDLTADQIRALLEQKNYEAAAEGLRPHLQQRIPDRSFVLLGVRLHDEQGQYFSAHQLMNRIASTLEGEALLQAASVAERAVDYDAALSRYSTFLTQNADHPRHQDALLRLINLQVHYQNSVVAARDRI